MPRGRPRKIREESIGEDAVRVFVGCDPNGHDADAMLALEWSLKAHSSLPVAITWMRLSRDERSIWSGWNPEAWATPFSGFRWAIPAACDFKGRAIYMDSDMVALGDIAELWRMPLEPGKVVIARGGESWRFCVSLWDCAAAKEHILPLSVLKSDPKSHATMTAYFKAHRELVQAFPAGEFWNYLDTTDVMALSDPRVKILHYTDMASQPHAKYALPRLEAAGLTHWFEASGGSRRKHKRPDMVAAFEEAYQGALADGYTVEHYLPAAPFGDFRKRSLANYRAPAA